MAASSVTALLPVVAGVSSVIASGYALHAWLRPKFSVTVNCWFCNRSTKVPFGNKNCWDCPHCDQYNGFNEDGGYNKPIPAQHEEFFNQSPYGCTMKCKQTVFPASNGLCDECNRNQQLKISALSHFVPLNEDNFDEEVDDYKEYLERVYRLCRRCEAVLRQSLGQQESYLRPLLLNWRLKRNCSNKSVTNFSGIYNPFIKTPCSHNRYTIILQFISCLALLLATIVHLPLKDFKTFPHLSSYYTSENSFLNPFIILVTGFVILVVGISPLFVNRTIRAFDWIGLLLWLIVLLPLNSTVVLSSINTAIDEKHLNAGRITTGVTILILCLASIFCPRKLNRNSRAFKLERKSVPSNNMTKKNVSTVQWVRNNLSSTSTLKENPRVSEIGTPTEILHDSLGAMSLGTQRNAQKTAGIFALHDYTNSVNYLQRMEYSEIRHRRPVLSPARLRPPQRQPVNLWTSKGYWTIHNKNPPPRSASWFNGSRSFSNLTSPLGTAAFQTSNAFLFPSCPASRAGSVYGGDDRVSVLSEPIFRLQPSNLTANHDDIVSQNDSNGDKRTREGSSEGSSSTSSSTTCPVDTTTTMNLSDNCTNFMQSVISYEFIQFD